MRIDIYSDTLCPWCYLGKRRFELALAARPQYESQVTWRPFELYPDMPVDGLDYAAFMQTKMAGTAAAAEANTELARLGEANGIQFRFDLIRRVPNTRRSHLLIAHAARYGLQGQVLERIMRGYFEEGCDIGDAEELVRLGTEAGLFEAEARNVLILRVGQDGVAAAEQHAAVLGIAGVPTYVFDGRYTISGAEEAAIFAGVFDRVAEFASARGVAG
ncbi:MAG: DsbA family oxidoreductase [Steroidobacteraceae bacterium]